jgi:cytochrome c oxidase subunit IV
MALEETPNVVVQPADKSKIRHIWMTALWLAVITAIEFLLAFVVERGMMLNTIFIILTLFKAYFIVSEFMHLRHEAKSLIWSILLPIILLLWLILALLIESTAIYDVKYLIM